MPERERAYRGQEVVTVIKGKPGKRGKVDIRNAHGFREEVDGRDLQPIPESEPTAKLHYGDAD